MDVYTDDLQVFVHLSRIFHHQKNWIVLRNRVLLVLGFVLFLLLTGGGIYGFLYYQKVFAPNVPNKLTNNFLYIPNNSSFESVLDSLTQNNFIIDTSSFKAIATRMKYIKNPMRAGRYKIEAGWSNYDLIRHLRGGKQATVKVVLTNERLPENVAAKVANVLASDSLSFIQLFEDENYLTSIGYTKETLMSIFIPNTYDFFWNTSPDKFMERMLKEHEIFWGKGNRLQLAQKYKLTTAEVYTLASIIEKETLRGDEKKRMAGVYMNRLDKGMLLQADPTAVFARRDFTTSRVTYYHTKFDDPYNTYFYPGLPPGPIAMASISSIDAVLNRENHSYLFFCAKGDGSGYHNFAKTLSQHNQNIAIYKRNLKKRGLR